jgi:hypothetical protein
MYSNKNYQIQRALTDKCSSDVQTFHSNTGFLFRFVFGFGWVIPILRHRKGAGKHAFLHAGYFDSDTNQPFIHYPRIKNNRHRLYLHIIHYHLGQVYGGADSNNKEAQTYGGINLHSPSNLRYGVHRSLVVQQQCRAISVASSCSLMQRGPSILHPTYNHR